MSVVGFSELRDHAVDQQYGLAVVNVQTLAVARGIIESANGLDAPLVLSVSGNELIKGLLPSLETMARQARVPIALIAQRIESTEQATLAIRLGCNALVLEQGLDDAVSRRVRIVAEACGIDVIEQGELSGVLHEVDNELESVTLNALERSRSSWLAIEQKVATTAAGYLAAMLQSMQAAGQGQAALERVKPWRPVEHLIIFNTTTDDTASAALAAEGRRVLDKIPGVRATWSGRAFKSDAGYRWCWLVRFAHKAVIDSYREHPDHVAYADKHFRPVAGDRISIDYELSGAEET